MMKPLLYSYITAILTVMAFACQSPPDYPIEPVIEYVSMGKSTLNQGSLGIEDSTIVTISFTDGDGDIGNFVEGADSTEADILLTDNRTNVTSGIIAPFVGTQGVGAGISGEIRFVLNTTCCIFENGLIPCTTSEDFPLDTLTYDIYIKDRAGNISNTVTTPPIFIRCN